MNDRSNFNIKLITLLVCTAIWSCGDDASNMLSHQSFVQKSGVLLQTPGGKREVGKRLKKTRGVIDDTFKRQVKLATPAETPSNAIYVSSSQGDDNNDGLSQNTPIQSISHALSLMGDNHQLLLKSGDAWEERIEEWNWDGTTLSSYGQGERPTIPFFYTFGCSNLTISNIHFTEMLWVFFNNEENLLVENCFMDGTYTTLVAPHGDNPEFRNVRFINNQILDAHSEEVLECGVYMDHIKGLLFEGNTVDYFSSEQYADLIFDHGIYLQHNCSDVVIRNNTFGHAPTNGIKTNSGAHIYGNTFLGNSIGIHMGASTDPGRQPVSGIIEHNTFIGAGRLNDAPRGTGISIAQADGVIVRNNKFYDANESVAVKAITLGGELRDVLVEDNVSSNWGSLGLNGSDETGQSAFENVMVRRNVFEGDLDGRNTIHMGVTLTDLETDLQGIKFRDNRYLQNIEERFASRQAHPHWNWYDTWTTTLGADDLGSELWAEAQDDWNFAVPADFNFDGVVDMDDFNSWVGAFGGTDWEYDINGDGIVDIHDFSLLLLQWG
ncbi:MAG: right-handed parallel beta-helix repeat-containing protein [Myxococcota bacterium]|nr:right-handed parallel beta-helix repeat-containing protein [Myxococcota bacterium]